MPEGKGVKDDLRERSVQGHSPRQKRTPRRPTRQPDAHERMGTQKDRGVASHLNSKICSVLARDGSTKKTPKSDQRQTGSQNWNFREGCKR